MKRKLNQEVLKIVKRKKKSMIYFDRRISAYLIHNILLHEIYIEVFTAVR